jgi:thiol:disulfide interchange protein
LPFLLIGFVPALRGRLPRPGAWMARFRQILAVPMALTALALGWLIWRQAGASGLLTALALGVGLAIMLDLIGRIQRRGNAVPVAALLAGAVTMAILPLALFPKQAQRNMLIAGALNAVPFNEQRLAALRQQGRPVFLYFTADWCVSCKVNEKAAIDRDTTASHFRKADITVMVGDWTNGDAAISRFLESQGRSGVPLYLFYPKGGGEPVVMPQVLTPSMLSAL